MATRSGHQENGASARPMSSLHNKYMKEYPQECYDGMLRLGNEVPDFCAETTQGPMTFHKWKEGKWAILCSHPADFTPTCTTELGSLASKHAELTRMGCRVAALSVDPLESHKEWIKDIVAYRALTHDEKVTVDFPIISDCNLDISTSYGMLDQWSCPWDRDMPKKPLTIRAVFIINPENKLMLTLNYPACVGRNMDEVVRCVRALQLSYNKSVATPADWPRNHGNLTLSSSGKATKDFEGAVFLLPTVSKQEAEVHYPGYHTCSDIPSKKEYLRLVKASDVVVGSVPPICTKDKQKRSQRLLKGEGKKRGVLGRIFRRISANKVGNKPPLRTVTEQASGTLTEQAYYDV
ncbi:1-Cys peroxiredoxin [Seminavis robusta]|uniref:1-Cys peroxiredoxin n=1 Tax=Seminavis robusta TaxID=568900 RepID=A0A9N8H7A7_9STRA|nr:1-Cys peroxiredoxin [Seminavis robusta]|eukprot:Sro123_g059640.1 1-Cys peroxiredoxin (350) ;mRNA; f:79134-80439